MKKQLIIAYLFSFFILPLKGQLSLDDCIRQAWTTNPQLKNRRIAIQEARAGQLKAIGGFLPRIAMQTEVGRYTGRSISPSTNQYTSDAYNKGMVGLDVSLSLFEGFSRINRLRVARSIQKEKEWHRLAKQNELAYQVAEAYYKVALNERMVELAKEQLRLGERYLKQAESFMELGLKSMSDWQEVKARHQGDLFQYTAYVKSSQMAKLYLKELLGLQEADSLSIQAIVEAEILPLPLPHEESLYAQSARVLPEYKRMEMLERVARKEYSLATGSFYPVVYARFSLASDFQDSFYSWSQLQNRRNNYIGVGISFPLFSGLGRYAEVKRKKYQLEQVRNNIEEEKWQLRTEVEQASLSLSSGWEEYRQSTLHVQTETQVLKENERKWEERLISVFQLMEARNRLLTAKAEQVRTRLQYELTSRLVTYYQTGTFIQTSDEE